MKAFVASIGRFSACLDFWRGVAAEGALGRVARGLCAVRGSSWCIVTCCARVGMGRVVWATAPPVLGAKDIAPLEDLRASVTFLWGNSYSIIYKRIIVQ